MECQAHTIIEERVLAKCLHVPTMPGQQEIKYALFQFPGFYTSQ